MCNICLTTFTDHASHFYFNICSYKEYSEPSKSARIEEAWSTQSSSESEMCATILFVMFDGGGQEFRMPYTEITIKSNCGASEDSYCL